MQSLNYYTEKAAALSLRNQCWIDGKYVAAVSGARFDCINPATGAGN